jgi:hypothetical protein
MWHYKIRGRTGWKEHVLLNENHLFLRYGQEAIPRAENR